MDPSEETPQDSLAAARLHIQRLTEAGLSAEQLMACLIASYKDEGEWHQPVSLADQLPKRHLEQLDHETRPHSVHSIDSRSSASTRSSVASTATSRSSVLSGTGDYAVPMKPTTPKNATISGLRLHPSSSAYRNTSGIELPSTIYWCAYCDTNFQRKYDWKRHEDEFHERNKNYPCPNCNRIFWGPNTFNQHHKNAHGCTTCPHANDVVKYTKHRTAWACGFCAALLTSQDRYFYHVSRHYEDGCTKRHWNHSFVIYGLLHQAALYPVWRELYNTFYGHLPREKQPLLEWDIETTGHQAGFPEGETQGKLQDWLQFFDETQGNPESLVKTAHDLARKVPPKVPLEVKQPSSLKGSLLDLTIRNRSPASSSWLDFDIRREDRSLPSLPTTQRDDLTHSADKRDAKEFRISETDPLGQYFSRVMIDEHAGPSAQGVSDSTGDAPGSPQDSGTDQISLDSLDIGTGQEAQINWASQLLINTIMRSLCRWLDAQVHISRSRIPGQCPPRRQCSPAAASSGQQHHVPSKDCQRPDSGSHGRENVALKRARNKPDRNDDGEDGPPGGKRWRGGALEVVDEEPRRFACPYFKRNPRKYGRVTTCPGPGWIEIHRVKDHLYRRHALPPQCPRCCEVFETEDMVSSHIRDSERCTKRDNDILHDGFTKAQGRQLRSRKKADKNMTDAERWIDIYRILFPDDDPDSIPSPYHEDIDLSSLSNASSSSSSCNHENFAEFMRREFPHYVRRELETLLQTDFQDVEETMRSRVSDIVLRLQPGLIALYDQSSEQLTSSADDNNPPPPLLPPPPPPPPPPMESPRIQDSRPIWLQPASTLVPRLQNTTTQASSSHLATPQQGGASSPTSVSNGNELWEFNFDWEASLGGYFAEVADSSHALPQHHEIGFDRS